MAERTSRTTDLTNATLAEQFESIAELLEVQDANPFHLQAYLSWLPTISVRSLSRM